MNSYIKRTVFFILFLSTLLSETKIKGIISHIDTDEPLIGANVLIEETSQGDATDIDGAYLIDSIETCPNCQYTLKVLYIGFEKYSETFSATSDKEIILNIDLTPTSLEVETTTITAKKNRDKITDAPAAIELVSAKDIQREESTNLGSYLKGIKGVDFTSSGINNYSISVRGFNSSFTSRLLTLTDGRIANIPALRVINYSTVPQSSKDVESIEIVLGPSAALYGANAHSGVVNITSKTPANSEGLDISVSGSVDDERDLYKFSSRWANKINEKLSFKISAMYLQAYEYEFISEGEYKAHKYPWNGHPSRMRDKKDNNPYSFSTSWSLAVQDTAYRNYLDSNGNGIFDPTIDIEYNEMVSDDNDCRVGSVDGSIYQCEQIIKYLGNGEANDTGDPDGDGFMGEDWFNGYDDDGDCPGDTNGDGLICYPGDEGVDEDYFFADGIDNDGDCPGDTNGDGIHCGPGDDNVDEAIDWTDDTWIDGVDNNNNGEVDEAEERFSNSNTKYNLPDWRYDIDFGNIIINNGRKNEYINGQYNPWYSDTDSHLRGEHYYDEEEVKLFFDVYVYDFGDDGIPGDSQFIDQTGDGNFYPWEGGNTISTWNGNINVATEGCSPPLGQNFCNEFFYDDCGLDGICYDDLELQDYGEANGIFDSFDWNNDGQYTQGDTWDANSWTDTNNDGYPFLIDNYGNIIIDDDIDWNDTWPPGNNVYDYGEEILDWGQDGIENTNDYGENDGILIYIDNNELDAQLDFGDGCFGCEAEPYIDNNNNGHYDCNTPDDPMNCDSFTDINNDGQWTPADYKDTFQTTYDINGDGYDDYPDFEVKNTTTEFRLDFDPKPDVNLTFQSGYAYSKTQQVTGTGRYIADGYRYTYYQLRGKYKNWFSQVYLNQGNSGETRGYDLGNMISDKSRNMAFQLQNNFDIKNTNIVWGLDFFRTEASTNGSILNDGPNGYDNDGDSWFTSKDDIDNDQDSNDFSDWGVDGIGIYQINSNGDLLIYDCSECEQIVTSDANDPNKLYNSTYNFWYIDSNGDGTWTTDPNISDDCYPFICTDEYLSGEHIADYGEGNGIPDFGEPGVNEDGLITVDQIDNDCDGCDYDGDGYPNFQEIQLNTNIYDPNSYPSAVSPALYSFAIDEMIDEIHCGSIEYSNYVPYQQFSGYRDGKIWTCAEGVDEKDEFTEVTSNEMGLYFQTKTIPLKNKKWEIITAARFDHHDQIEEDIQFSPKFGIFYKPSSLQTFRLTYGKAYNTPSALTLFTDLFIGKRGIIDYYLRGNRDGTPYLRVGDEYITSTPQVEINNELYNMVNITGSGDAEYWDEYSQRVQGAPYFLGFNTEFSDVPEFMPIDTLLYTVWVPELTDTGRIYTALETINMPNVEPIKTEKIQTLEIGFKGFISKRIHLTTDYYISFYEDFFSSPTVVTPLIIRREFDDEGNDITSFENGIDVVGMLPINYNMSNPPYATQWDGRDNDNDWKYFGDHVYFDNYSGYSSGTISSYDNPDLDCTIENGGCYEPDGGWYHWFNWDGHEEIYEDWNDNGMYDYGEPFNDEDDNGSWNCIDCAGEWGYVDWIQGDNGDTLGYTIHRAQDVIIENVAMEYGNIQFEGSNAQEAQFWIPVGIDEYSAINGLSEAEMVTSPLIDANGNPVVGSGFAYTPLHSILAPMNYGEIWNQGLDVGLTYLIPNKRITLEGNFSLYKSTNYYNTLTKKNDPINAPKFKMNASVAWESPIGNFALKYRHVDRYEWKDGIWSGIIGPYDLFDLHYNYKVNRYLELNLTGMNIFNDRHKEMIGGAIMGRQIILRLTASI